MVSNTTKGAYLKIIRMPDGPNTTFKIDSFTLATDVRAGLDNPKMLQADYTSHSVLVTKGIRNDKLIRQALVGLFPAPKNLKVCKRVTLFTAEDDKILFRHY